MSLAWALPLVIALEARSASVSPRPVAWAAQSPRPAACQGSPGLWELSRQARLGRRCRELARAQALLLRAPEKAHARATQLLEQAPDFVAARVVRGRARLRLGDTSGALADLRPLAADDAGELLEPAALLDGGRAALAERDLQSATRFYRLLGNRAALLPDTRDQIVAYVEVAATLLASGAAGVDEVQAFLREARRRSPGSGYTGLCASLSAVAWLSSGREAEGQGALVEVGDRGALERFEKRDAVWLPDGMFDALMGVALEKESPEAAAAHYRALAEGPLAGTAVGKLGARPRAKDSGKRGAR